MRHFILFFLLIVSVSLAAQTQLEKSIKNMKWRPIGPANMGAEVQSLMGTIDGADAKPTAPQMARVKELEQELTEAKTTYQKILNTDIAQINEKVKDMPQIVVAKPVKTDM